MLFSFFLSLICAEELKTQRPLIVVMALSTETKTIWFERTIKSLQKFNYEYIVMPSTPKFSSIPGANATETIRAMRLNLWHSNGGQLGCWASHLRAWSLMQSLKRPIISLEADTYAIQSIENIPRKILQEFDIMFVHDHRYRKRKCEHGVEYGRKARYATGAMLFTGRTPLSKVIDMIDTDLPIDHWLNEIEQQKKLKVATFCPSLFLQPIDKKSLIN